MINVLRRLALICLVGVFFVFEGTTEAQSLIQDGFDGDTLPSHWVQIAGNSSNFTVGNGYLNVLNANGGYFDGNWTYAKFQTAFQAPDSFYVYAKYNYQRTDYRMFDFYLYNSHNVPVVFFRIWDSPSKWILVAAYPEWPKAACYLELPTSFTPSDLMIWRSQGVVSLGWGGAKQWECAIPDTIGSIVMSFAQYSTPIQMQIDSLYASSSPSGSVTDTVYQSLQKIIRDDFTLTHNMWHPGTNIYDSFFVASLVFPPVPDSIIFSADSQSCTAFGYFGTCSVLQDAWRYTIQLDKVGSSWAHNSGVWDWTKQGPIMCEPDTTSHARKALFVKGNSDTPAFDSLLVQAGLDVTLSDVILPPQELSAYDVVLVGSYGASNPTTAAYLETYLAAGGGVVVISGCPLFLGLSGIQHWFGATSYVNSWGSAADYVKSPAPFDPGIADGALLTDHRWGSGAGDAGVTGVLDPTHVLGRWRDGPVFAFWNTYGAGRMFYSASIVDIYPQNHEENNRILWKSALKWAAGIPATLPVADRAAVFPDSLPPVPNMPVTITIGNSGVGRDVSDIDPATIRINGTLSPTSVGVQAGHSGFTGSVFVCVTKVRDLRTTYADRSASGLQLVISGAYRDGISFTVQAPIKFYEIWVGDVNGDGFVDGKDATALASYLKTGKPVPVSIDNADVNRDGKINLSDLSALVSLIVGTKTTSNTF